MDAALLTPLLLLAFVVLVAINLAAFAAFGMDKRRAEEGDRRIPERTLLALALWGGTAGRLRRTEGLSPQDAQAAVL